MYVVLFNYCEKGGLLLTKKVEINIMKNSEFNRHGIYDKIF